MKYVVLSGLALLLSLFNATAQLSSGLVAHWPFNGTVNDTTGNGHNGIAQFISYGAGENGVPNSAAVFNGTSSHINVAHKSDLNLSDYTICAIVKPTGYYTGNCQGNVIIQRSNETLKGYWGIVFSDNPYNDCSTVDTSKYVFFSSALPPTAFDRQYSPAIVSNNWYKVIVTYRNDTTKTYVNGVLKSSYVTTTPTGTSTEGLTIGALYQQIGGSFPYWFKGVMDDIRVYNRVLTATEIKQYTNDMYVVPPVLSTLCKTVPFNISYNTVNDFQSGNVFSVELSDNTGSFAAPTVIGTTTATTGGIITCTVPAGVPLGSGYRMRVKSSLPVKISDTFSATVNLAANAPSVSISVAPSVYVLSGSSAFFSALPVDGGATPVYQWRRNRMYIPGANAITYTAVSGTDFVSGDTIDFVLKSSNVCATPDSAVSNMKIMSVNNQGIASVGNNTFSVYPNPSNGNITISGNTGNNKRVSIAISNTLGQVIYRNDVSTLNNKLHTTISLPSSIANGMYYIKLDTDAGHESLKVLINR